MGCHTRFGRPITKDEISILKEVAKKSSLITDDLNTICSLGIAEYEDYIWFAEGKPYLDLASREFSTSPEIFHVDKESYFLDNFRIKNYYPNWVIHNKRQLRKKMRSDYFDLTKEQLEDITRFFKTYPGGVIIFG